MCPRSDEIDYASDQFASNHYRDLIYTKGEGVARVV